MGLIQRWNENRTLDTMLREERAELAPEVSEEAVRNRIASSIRRNDFQSLKALHEYFPQVDPDYDSVQRAYARHYDRKELQSAHKLFDVFGIEPEHQLSEEVVKVSSGTGTFSAVVINKEVKRRPLIKDKYIVTFHLPDQDFTFKRKVSAQEFYQGLQQGSTYQITVPILQKVNMLGHEVRQPYISPSNLLLG